MIKTRNGKGGQAYYFYPSLSPQPSLNIVVYTLPLQQTAARPVHYLQFSHSPLLLERTNDVIHRARCDWRTRATRNTLKSITSRPFVHAEPRVYRRYRSSCTSFAFPVSGNTIALESSDLISTTLYVV